MTGDGLSGESPYAAELVVDTAAHPQLIAGRYEVIGTIGQGGMGSVLKARHVLLNKTVAIKVLNPAVMSDATTWKRFQIEAQAGGKMSHPNLVSVFDFGRTGDQPYLVMDYIEGYSVDSLVQQRGKLGADEFLDIFMQVGKALQYLHNQNVVHRDLKPHNIMIQVIGDERYAKLIDLGIAKVFSDDGNTADHLTATGMVFGSPRYMSPEQCRGAKVDWRSDIYSLGCVMYECLCGHPPFVGANQMQIIFMHVNDGPQPIECNTETERCLALVIEKCMNKEVTARYQSVAELLTALGDIKEGSRQLRLTSGQEQLSRQAFAGQQTGQGAAQQAGGEQYYDRRTQAPLEPKTHSRKDRPKKPDRKINVGLIVVVTVVGYFLVWLLQNAGSINTSYAHLPELRNQSLERFYETKARLEQANRRTRPQSSDEAIDKYVRDLNERNGS